MEPMRRKERELSFDEGLRILDEAEYGVLALNGVDGTPHAIPISFAVDQGMIYIHTAKEGYKTRCLAESRSCCFTVVGKTQVLPEAFSTLYESCIIYGELEEVPEEMRSAAFEAILNKYSKNFLEEGRAYASRAGFKTALYQLKSEKMTVKGRK